MAEKPEPKLQGPPLKKKRVRRAHYLVSSNSHVLNLDSAINRLLGKDRFIDVTLACNGHKFHCHRLVLSAYSPLFEELLVDNPTEHPIIILPMGIRYQTLKSLIDFMYTGHTNVNEVGLQELIESAQLLQVLGISDGQAQFRQYFADYSDDEEEEEEAVEQEQAKQKQEQETPPTEQQQELTEQATNQEPETQEEQIPEFERVEIENKDYVKKSSEQIIVDYIEIEDSQDAPDANVETAPIENETTPMESDNYIPETIETAESTNQVEEIATEPAVDPNTKYITIINSTDGITTKDTKMLKPIAPKVIATALPPISVNPTIKLINLIQVSRPKAAGQKASTAAQTSRFPWTYIHIPAPTTSQVTTTNNKVTSVINPVSAATTQVTWANAKLPWTINPISKPAKKPAHTVVSGALQAEYAARATPVPSFLKFNSSSMAISVKNLDRTDKQEKVKVVNMAMEEDPEPEAVSEIKMDTTAPMAYGQQHEVNRLPVKTEYEHAPEANTIELGDTIVSQADFPNFYALIKKERDDKLAKEKQEAEALAAAEAENIICQPSVSYIYGGDYDETYGTEDGDLLKPQAEKSKKAPRKRQGKPKKKAEPSPKFFSPGIFTIPKSHRSKYSPTLVPLSVMQSSPEPKLSYYPHKLDKDLNGQITYSQDRSIFNTVSNSPPREGESHSPQTVILRNPRCNQPRHYSTDSLYNALMAVKYGESIYRASRLHQVPRKTLRNWMKRWDIKSQFPMPKQLEDAAKKKKQTQCT